MRLTLLSAVVVALAAVAASGCSKDSSSPAAGTAPEPEVVVVRNQAELPAGCDPASVARLVGEFAAALNAGDPDRVRALTAPATDAPMMTVDPNENGETNFLAF